jgi:hypothetical protein
MYVACAGICSAMNLLAAGLANMYEARNGGEERCDVTKSTIPVIERSRRYGPSTLVLASFEDLEIWLLANGLPQVYQHLSYLFFNSTTAKSEVFER